MRNKWIIHPIHILNKRIPLKNKILFFNALVLILALFTLAVSATRISADAMVNKAEKSSIRELELIDKNLNTTLNSMEEYARVISTDFRLQEQLLMLMKNPRAVNESLKGLEIRSLISSIVSNIISPNTRIAAASVLTSSGTIAYSGYNTDDSSIASSLNSELLEQAASKQIPVWTNLLELRFNDGTKMNVFGVLKLVIDKEKGEKTGWVALWVNENEISRIYLENRTKESDRFFIIDQNDRIVSSNEKNDLNRPFTDITNLEKKQFSELKKNGKIIITENGQKLFVSMHIFSKLGWNVINIISLEELTSENRKIQTIILAVGFVCLLLAIMASYLISYTVTRPVNQLSDAMKSIIDGNMNIRAETKDGGEIGLLAQGFNNLMDRIEDLVGEIYEEQKAKREFEFKLIQSQIKPHFLYNSLETVISLNKLGRYNDANNTIKCLANFYRSSLSKGNDIISIREEIDMTNNYLLIQMMRYSNYLEYDINVDVAMLDLSIPKLTLQPLVENSIYHGLKYKGGKGKLEIKGYVSGNQVIMEVSDNGVGIPEERIAGLLTSSVDKTRNEDFGLGSVNRRLKILYGNEYGVMIDSKVGLYTEIVITIPAVKMKG